MEEEGCEKKDKERGKRKERGNTLLGIKELEMTWYHVSGSKGSKFKLFASFSNKNRRFFWDQ
jgi:hypothetical protein